MADAGRNGKATLSRTEVICAIHRYVLSTSCLRVVSIAACTCSPGCYDRVHCEGVAVEFGNEPKVSKALCVTSVP